MMPDVRVKYSSGLHDKINIQQDKRVFFFSKLDFYLKDEIAKCCIWSTNFIVLHLGE
jgi:hypothetical protein